MARSSPLSRAWQIRRVIRQHQLLELLENLQLSRGARLALRLTFGKATSSDQPRGERIREALVSLGPVFVKLGQALSTRPDLLPEDIAAELTKLQDQVPPFAGAEAMRLIEAEFGNEADKIFAHIETEALASASVAQVHAATLQPGLAQAGKNGLESCEVIIKILRPGVTAQVEKDLQLMYMVANLLQKFWRRAGQFQPLRVIQDYENTIRGELDLRLEAANCSQMGANFEGNDIIYVPIVYWDYTSRSVLVMERIHGTSVRDVKQLKALGYDLKQLAADGVTTFFKQAFVDNFFHADMHPGNIFVSDQGKWIAIDFGIMGVLEEGDKRYLAEMLLGFFNRDYRAIADAHLRAGWIPPTTRAAEFESAIRMVCEPNFAKPIAEISFGKVLVDLFQTVQRFEMPVQPQLVLLYKTLLNIEGLGRQLYPQLNLWDTAKPFLENWMKEQLSPQGLLNDFKRDWPRWQGVLQELPDHLARLQAHSMNLPLQTKQSERHLQELQRSRRATFHHVLGFGTAFVAVVTGIATWGGVLQPNAVSHWAGLIGIAGVAWAFWHSR